MKRRLFVAAILALATGFLLVVAWRLFRAVRTDSLSRGDAAPSGLASSAMGAKSAPAASSELRRKRSAIVEVDPSVPSEGGEDVAEESEEEPNDPETEELSKEEKLVEAFDELTDKWADEDSKARVGDADVAVFVAHFKRLPEDRREECLQRALNLVPDANVKLLTSILFDPSVDHEMAELIFNDILNRDEEVKDPVVKQIAKDPKHPCHEDAVWLLDGTEGE